MHVLGNRPPFEEVVRNLYFDLAIYDQDSMEMLIRKVGVDRVMFASEMFGTSQGIDPQTGKCFDDTVPFVKGIESLSDADREAIFEGNARKVFSRAKF
jgi:4-oxalmesaconate hydratase